MVGRLIILLVVSCFLVSCKVKPEACFSIDKSPIETKAKVPMEFTSCSDNAEELRWSFGDGTFETGLQVIHVYSMPGSYKVTLTAINGERSDEVSETVEVLP